MNPEKFRCIRRIHVWLWLWWMVKVETLATNIRRSNCLNRLTLNVRHRDLSAVSEVEAVDSERGLHIRRSPEDCV